METWDLRTLDVAPHKPVVLRSDEDSRVIAIELPAGEQLGEHQVHERAYLIVAGGEIEVSQDGEQVSGGAGFVAYFPPGERHAVRAISDAKLVLLLAPWPGEGHPSRTSG